MSPVTLLLFWPVLSARAEYEQKVTLTFIRENNIDPTALKCFNAEQFYLKEDIPTMMYIIQPRGMCMTVDKFECYRHDNTTKKIFIGDLSKDNNNFKAPIQNISSLINYKYSCYFLLNKNMYLPDETHYEHDGNTYIKVDCEFRVAIKCCKSLKVEINGNVLDSEPVFTSNEVDAKVTYKFVSDELVNIKCKRPHDRKGKIWFIYRDYASLPNAKDDVGFQVILKPHQHKTHIDCTFEEEGVKTVLRVFMFLEQKQVEDIIRVNGLAIRTSGDIVTYKYTGAVPTVSCPGPVDVTKCHKSCGNYEDEALCTAGGKITKIHMSKEFPLNGIYIEGLIDNKIIFQTYENDNCIRRIHYAYTDDDVIQLSATYKSEDVYCRINGLSSVEEQQELHLLRMRKENNITNATCKSSIFTTYILFHYVKRDSVNKQPSDPIDPDEHYLYKVAVPAFVLVILLVGITVAVRNKRNSATKVDQAEDMANTENSTQWPKRLHADIYVEPQKNTVDCAAAVATEDDISPYSTANPQNIDDLYTKPVPKNQRINNKDKITYADLQFKENNIYSRINPIKPQCIYSEVRHVQPNNLYATVIHKDNVNTGSYANATEEEYVTPYCDVNALKINKNTN